MNTVHVQGQRTGKRQRLIDAACRSYYQRGLAESTLKIIASEANVPLGNMYYYFPTKDDLTLAVLRDLQQRLETELGRFDEHPDPRESILAYLDYSIQHAQPAAQYGCLVTTLASELHKQRASSASLAAEVTRTYQNWLELQLQGLPIENPGVVAEEFFAVIQGAYTIACAKQDPSVFTRLLAGLCKRVQQLPPPSI